MRRILSLFIATIFSLLCTAGEQVSKGTGFVISKDGLIATELSVVENAKDILIYGLGASVSEVYRAEVIRRDFDHRFAVLKVNKTFDFKPMDMAMPKPADTIKIVYDNFFIFHNEVHTEDAEYRNMGADYQIFKDFEEYVLGAPVMNRDGQVLGFVSKGSTGRIDRMVSLEGGAEIEDLILKDSTMLDTLNKTPQAPIVCAVIGYDEMMNVEVSSDFSFKRQDLAKKREEIIERLGLEFVEVEGGTYLMGCEGNQDDHAGHFKTHEVTVNTFKICKYEVTQKQWNAIMDKNPSLTVGDDLPVYNVSYADAKEFLRRVNEANGTQFRLPTEAEWEFAARGGVKSRNTAYSGSDNLDEVAWYRDNANGKPHQVGQKKPNELGLYDMCGNVSEWCDDDYESYETPDHKTFYYSTMEHHHHDHEHAEDGKGEAEFVIHKIDESEKIKNQLMKGRKVMRGSGFFHEKSRCSITHRRACAVTDKYTFGFRIAE